MEVSTAEPELTSGEAGDGRRLVLSGDWVVAHAGVMEHLARDVDPEGGGGRIVLDLAGLGRLDTVGVLMLQRVRDRLGGPAAQVSIDGVRAEQKALIKAISDDIPEDVVVRRRGAGEVAIDVLAAVGAWVADIGHELVSWVALLGAIIAAIGGLVLHPQRFRVTSFVFHLDHVGLRSIPVVTLISFLVGAIVAQQGIFQLRQFGGTIFVVNLIGVLTLRELGVLLTSIMLAGRSGSAFTAEVGSMKMREEIDALRVMALDPVEVLIVPRLLALIVGLTMLTFLAELAALAGGGLVIWAYGGISPVASLARLKTAIDVGSFEVGLVKAPFMALVIGVIAAIEGLKVEGSAESLGLHTTASVVKAIFMVIVLDGIFAVLFASIGL